MESLPPPPSRGRFPPTPNLGKENIWSRFPISFPPFSAFVFRHFPPSLMAPDSPKSSPRSSGPDYTLLMPILLAPLIPLVGLSLRRRPQLAVPVGLCTSGIVLLGAHHSGLSVSTRE